MTSSPPALVRRWRGAVPLLLVAACAGACGSTSDLPRAAAALSSSSSTAPTTTTTTTTAPPPVQQIVDGRTLINAAGKRLQVVGLAPPGECWAQAATEFATTTLAGKQIKVVPVSGDQVGVQLPDGSDFAETALRKGMARAEPTANSALTAAQAVAQQAEIGLWGGTCKGADTLAPPPPPPPPVTKVQPVVPPPPASTPDPPASAYYKNCTAARAAGVTPLRRGDPGYGSHLDRDGDGIACE